MANEIVISRAQLRMERAIAHRPDPNTGLRLRDIGGNKLVDVVNPVTGLCTGTRSAIESPANNVPGSPKSGISVNQADLDNLPHYDADKGVWFVGKDRLVQRTIDTPEGPLRVARVVKPAVAEKLDKRASAASKVKRAPKDGSTKQPSKPKARTDRTGVTGIGTGPTAKEIKDYVATKYGYTGAISAEIRRAARVAIEHERQVSSHVASHKADVKQGNKGKRTKR